MPNNEVARLTVLFKLLFHSKTTCFYIVILYIPLLLVQKAGIAQIIPSSNTNTSINVQQVNGARINQINGGTTQGVNLFHEFREFNLDSRNAASFISPSSIDNIVATIQSKDASRINSLISVEGTANLFLLNRNGFIFGPNSALDLQGSLTISTANKLKFSDGFNYYTTRENQNISTKGIPLQLILTPQSKGININSFGHGLSFIPVEGDVSTPTIISGAGRSSDGFKLRPSKSISLIGNGIYFDGGLITAPSGNIFITSISEGLVNINFSKSEVFYTNASKNEFSNITLNNKSLIDTSGSASSKIGLHGNSIILKNASYILNQSTNTIESSRIEVFANKKLTIEGTTNPLLFVPFNVPGNVQSSIFAQDFSGKGTNITVNTQDIELKNGGTIEALAFGSGFSGNININALNSILINGDSPLEPIQAVSIIITANFDTAKAGSLLVQTNDLRIEKAGAINSGTFSTKPGGDIKISVENSLILNGLSPITLSPSLISSSTFRDGSAGNINIEARSFRISNGGVVSTSTLASGDSGDISISSKNLTIDGEVTLPFGNTQPIIAPAGITASGIPSTPLFQAFFRTPPFPSGDSGNIKIDSENVVIKNSGNVGAENGGTGDAGSVSFRVKNLLLSNNGSISTRTNEGNGGNINIFAQSVILKSGILSASALQEGLGGNITVNSGVFVSFDKSIASANAVNDRGGNITFNTFGFFPSPDTKITATSALGEQFDGTITFSNPDRDLGLANTLVEVKPQKSEISSVCNPRADVAVSEFFRRGEGGLPMGATDQLTSASGWHDPSGESEQPSNTTAYTPEIVHIDDAQGLVINPDGTGSLVSYSNLPINKAEKPNNCNAKISPNTPTAAHPQPNRTGSDSTLSARPNTPETTTTKAPTHSSATTTP